MEFVQIIEYQTSKPDEVRALGEELQAKREAEGGQGPRQLLSVKDRDRENVYLTIVRFPSYEAAMENSQREDTGAFAAKMAALCDAPATFRNLDVLTQYGA